MAGPGRSVVSPDPVGFRVNPSTGARFVRIVAAHPGSTASELEQHLERVHDRLMLASVLKHLVGRCYVRRDDEGRFWPV